jgi:hypothetical protein
VDAATAEKMKIAESIGQESFEENTQLLKDLALRGLRAFVLAIIGLSMFTFAKKRKRRQLEEEEAAAKKEQGLSDDDDDPTARYLKEMGSIGFDVEGLEKSIAEEKEKNKKSK